MGAMPAEERQTHKNLAIWMQERAKSFGVKEEPEEEESEDDAELVKMLEGGTWEEGEDKAGSDSEEDEKETKGKPSAGQALESHFGKDKKDEDEEQGTIDKGKNRSSVNVAYKESKLNFRGSLNTISFTNWLWYRCIRPRLEETKAKLPELSPEEISAYGIDDIEEIFGEFMPVEKEQKDKKEDKDDKKDKKGDKKDKKDEKETKGKP